MKRIEKYLEIRKKKHAQDNDTVGAIVGFEGISKTTLGLHIYEHWNKINFGEVKPSDIKYIGLTKEQFAQAIAGAKKNGMPVFDEAGSLNNRRTLSRFNTAMMEAYQVIRADRLFTLLILPDFFSLDSYFRRHRVKFLICVYARGRCAFWGRDDLVKINAYNETRLIKSPWIVKPRFYDTFPKYDGVLKEQYEELKRKKVKETREELPSVFSGKTPKVSRTAVENKILLKMKDAGMTQQQIGAVIGLTRQAVGYRLAEGKRQIEI